MTVMMMSRMMTRMLISDGLHDDDDADDADDSDNNTGLWDTARNLNAAPSRRAPATRTRSRKIIVFVPSFILVTDHDGD